MIPQPSVETRTIGTLRVHAIQAGGQRLDGGAMFGVVPKPLWERRIPADQRNRIQLGMRCLLIEHEIGSRRALKREQIGMLQAESQPDDLAAQC